MDRNIEAVVIDRVTTAPADAEIICGNSDYTITFSFDDEWEGVEVKTALFKWLTADGMRKYEQPFTGDVVEVPVITDTREVEVGVYAGDLTTTTGAPIRCLPSIRCGSGEKVEPDPDKYDILMELIKSGALDGQSAYDAAVAGGYEGTEAEFGEALAKIASGEGDAGLTKEQAEEITANTEARHTHANADYLDSLAERPTATLECPHDWMEQTNSDVSEEKSNLFLIKAIKDESLDYLNKEIARIEYSLDDGASWIDVRDIVARLPDKPCVLQIHKSLEYNDGAYDTVCFGSAYFPQGVGVNPLLSVIQNQSHYGFRVTYYTD